MEMTKFLNKLFLFGIILGGANLDAAHYPGEAHSLRGVINNFEQFYSVDFSNNAASNKNTISAGVNYESNTSIREQHVIGHYDENEYLEYIDDTNNKNKVVKILCRLDSDNIGSEYNLGNWLSVYPIGAGFYSLGDKVSSADDLNYNKFPLQDSSGTTLYYVDADTLFEKEVMNLFDNTGAEVGKAVLVKLGETYEVKTFENGITYSTTFIEEEAGDRPLGRVTVLKEVASRPLAYEKNAQTQEWATLNSEGTEVEPLNKAKVLIDQGASITMQSLFRSKITVTKFGELENKGTLTLKSGNVLETPSIILTEGEEQDYKKTIKNLDAVAVNNEGGEIVVEAGGKITGDGVIKGGKVDLSKLIPSLISHDSLFNADHYTTSFYNTEIVITKDESNIDKFSSITEPLFTNVKFYSDLDGETRHSTVQMPVSVLSYSNDLTFLGQYNTLLPLVYASSASIGTGGSFSNVEQCILKMFNLNSEDFKDDKTKCPLQFSASTGKNLYEFMNKMATVTVSIGGVPTTLDTLGKLAVDLFSFSFDSPDIEYSKFKADDESLTNLAKVQFVCNNESAQDKNLNLLPGNNEEETALTVRQEFNNWPGTLSFDESVKPLTFENTVGLGFGWPFYTYNVKLNDAVELITSGNIVLNLANSGELTLGSFEHKGGILHINSLNGEELLIKVKAGKTYKHTGNGAVYYHGPVSLTLTA